MDHRIRGSASTAPADKDGITTTLRVMQEEIAINRTLLQRTRDLIALLGSLLARSTLKVF